MLDMPSDFGILENLECKLHYGIFSQTDIYHQGIFFAEVDENYQRQLVGR